jgi:ISXO2-like transposase domain
MSALSLKRTLDIGSYRTAWAMLHRLRSVLVRPGRDRLTGMVEVEETYIGGQEAGLPGGRARGKKVLTGIAVEVLEPKGFGRCRLRPLADASAASLQPFVTDLVEPGAKVITDGWQGYSGLEKLGATFTARAVSGLPGPAERALESDCPGCTGSHRWSSGGCWVPTRAQWTVPIWPAT